MASRRTRRRSCHGTERPVPSSLSVVPSLTRRSSISSTHRLEPANSSPELRPDAAATASDSRTFHLFPRLPPELRHHIFLLSTTLTPRTITITRLLCISTCMSLHSTSTRSTNTLSGPPPPSLLSVNREARHLALALYTCASQHLAASSPTGMPESLAAHGPRASHLWNPAADVLYMHDRSLAPWTGTRYFNASHSLAMLWDLVARGADARVVAADLYALWPVLGMPFDPREVARRDRDWRRDIFPRHQASGRGMRWQDRLLERLVANWPGLGELWLVVDGDPIAGEGGEGAEGLREVRFEVPDARTRWGMIGRPNRGEVEAQVQGVFERYRVEKAPEWCPPRVKVMQVCRDEGKGALDKAKEPLWRWVRRRDEMAEREQRFGWAGVSPECSPWPWYC